MDDRETGAAREKGRVLIAQCFSLPASLHGSALLRRRHAVRRGIGPLSNPAKAMRQIEIYPLV